MICLAGPAAQRHWNPRSWRHYHGATDYELAADLALRLQGSDELATAYLRWLGVKVRSSIENNWRFVVSFAARLLEKGSLDFAEIQEVIACRTAPSVRFARADRPKGDLRVSV